MCDDGILVVTVLALICVGLVLLHYSDSSDDFRVVIDCRQCNSDEFCMVNVSVGLKFNDVVCVEYGNAFNYSVGVTE